MSYASDKLYNGYLRRRMPAIVSKVKVREIIIHLPCLTAHDRETIEAKRETNGNFDSMVLLLDCLRRRESWPEQFIQALQECEHQTIAAEIQTEYDTLRGANNSNPGSPPTTVITAHVHPAPSASHLPVPESAAGNAGTTETPAAPPQEPTAPPQEPTAPPTPPLEAPEVSAPERPSSPALAAQLEALAVPSTPPPSPETPSHSTTESPPTEVNVGQEPEENSESDIQVIPGDGGAIPDQVSAEAAPAPTEQCDTDSLSGPDLSQTTTMQEAAASPQVERKVQQEPEENSESDLLGITSEVPDHMTPEESQVSADPLADTPLLPDPVQSAETTEVVGAAPPEEPEPEELSRFQEISGDLDVIPDGANAANIKVVVDFVMTPPMSPCEKDTPLSVPEPVQTWATTDAAPPPQSPTSPLQESLDVSVESAFPILTPEKLPVQETSPTEDNLPAVAMETEEATKEATEEATKEATEEATKEATEEAPEEATEEATEPATIQVVEMAPPTETASAPSPLLDANGLDDALISEDDLLSKPEVLLSTEPPNHVSPTLTAFDPPSEPYSGDSGRLEISLAEAPACAAAAAVAASTVIIAEPPCQENGIALNHHDEEPEDNHCESSCPSLDSQDVLVNVGHVSEEPSILNLHAQAPQIVNGEAARESAPAPPLSCAAADDDDDDDSAPSDHTCLLPPEPAAVELKTLPESPETKALARSNSKYYLTAAGLGACALLMAWKFKH